MDRHGSSVGVGVRSLRRSATLLRILFGGVIGLLLVPLACRTIPVENAAPAVATLTDARGRPEQLLAGRAVYVSENHCGHCHSPKRVADHSPDEWTNKIMPRMSKKAKLTPEEYDQVLTYVVAASSQVPTAKR